MNNDAIIASRESFKISEFMGKMVAQERMTASERQVVLDIEQSVSRAAGQYEGFYVDDPANTPVTRHCNHLAREKIIELHPELANDLEAFINHRPYHPLPAVPESHAKPGAALAEYFEIHAFIDEKRKQGLLTHNEAHDVYEPANRIFEDSGVYAGAVDETTEKAVLFQSSHLMKKKLLELHPEFADELRNRLSSRSK